MRFTNKNKILLFKLGYIFLLLIVFSIITYNYIILRSPIFTLFDCLLFILFSTFICFYWYNISKFIQYDSTGLGLVFVSKGIVISNVNNYREQRIEIPKNKLSKFNINTSLFYKKLELYIISSNITKKVILDITSLDKKKIKNLHTSLQKVVQENSTS
jgi:hypothetical protein